MYDIKNLFLFDGLTDEQLGTVTGGLTDVVCFARGEVIYDNEHFRRALGVFLSGKGLAGNSGTVKTSFCEGDVFGAAALFGADKTYVSRITAKTSCKVLFIDEETLRRIFGLFPICSVNYVSFLSDRVRYLNGKIAQYTGDCASARLYRLLCDMADGTGRVADVNMSLLAGLLGMGRTSVYRAAAELEENGSVIRQGKNIYVRR